MVQVGVLPWMIASVVVSFSVACFLFYSKVLLLYRIEALNYNSRMGFKPLRRYIGGGLMIVSLSLAIWGFMPRYSFLRRVVVNSPALQNQTVVVDIDAPYLMRLGEAGRLQVALSLDMPDSAVDDVGDSLGILETEQGETRSTNLLSRARFELARLPALPAGELIETFSRDSQSVFIWRINAEELGKFPGRIWLYIQPQSGIPNNEDLTLSEPLTVQSLTLRVVSLLGLRLESLKLLSIVGIALGVLLLGDDLRTLLVRFKQQIR